HHDGRRAGGLVPLARRGPRRRHHDHRPGALARAAAVRRGERLPRQLDRARGNRGPPGAAGEVRCAVRIRWILARPARTCRGAEGNVGGLVRSRWLRAGPGARAGVAAGRGPAEPRHLAALARGAHLLVMDEPTAALSTEQADRLLEVVRGLRRNGTTVVFVS